MLGSDDAVHVCENCQSLTETVSRFQLQIPEQTANSLDRSFPQNAGSPRAAVERLCQIIDLILEQLQDAYELRDFVRLNANFSLPVDLAGKVPNRSIIQFIEPLSKLILVPCSRPIRVELA